MMTEVFVELLFSKYRYHLNFIGMEIKDIHQSTGYFNLHSSYLHSIYYLGFVGYIIIFILLISLFLQFYIMKFSLFLIFSSLLLRISTDVGCLCGYFDLPFWMLILSSLPRCKNLTKNVHNFYPKVLNP